MSPLDNNFLITEKEAVQIGLYNSVLPLLYRSLPVFDGICGTEMNFILLSFDDDDDDDERMCFNVA